MKMRLQKKIFLRTVALIAAGLLFLEGLVLWHTPGKQHARAGGPQELSGYAWSSNIGWIKFRGLDAAGNEYGVSIDASGVLSGSAWAGGKDSNGAMVGIGWLDFDRTKTCDPPTEEAGGSAGAPRNLNDPSDPGNCDGSGPIARLKDGVIQGWARFRSGENPNLTADLWSGWDGWVKFSGLAASGAPYRVEIDPNYADRLRGYAWGGDVVGWISFRGSAQNGEPYGVYIGAPAGTLPMDVALFAEPDVGVGKLDSVDLTAVAYNVKSGDTISFTFACGIDNNNDGVEDGKMVTDTATGNPFRHTEIGVCSYSGKGVYNARVKVQRGSETRYAKTTITILSGGRGETNPSIE